MNVETLILNCGFAEEESLGNLIVTNEHDDYTNAHAAIKDIMDAFYGFARQQLGKNAAICCQVPRITPRHEFCPFCGDAFTEISTHSEEGIREHTSYIFKEATKAVHDEAGDLVDYMAEQGWLINGSVDVGNIICIDQFDRFLTYGFETAAKTFAHRGRWNEIVGIFHIDQVKADTVGSLNEVLRGLSR